MGGLYYRFGGTNGANRTKEHIRTLAAFHHFSNYYTAYTRTLRLPVPFGLGNGSIHEPGVGHVADHRAAGMPPCQWSSTTNG